MNKKATIEYTNFYTQEMYLKYKIHTTEDKNTFKITEFLIR